MKEEALRAARAAFEIESDSIAKMAAYMEDTAFSEAVALLANAPRIGTSGCGHSGWFGLSGRNSLSSARPCQSLYSSCSRAVVPPR